MQHTVWPIVDACSSESVVESGATLHRRYWLMTTMHLFLASGAWISLIVVILDVGAVHIMWPTAEDGVLFPVFFLITKTKRCEHIGW